MNNKLRAGDLIKTTETGDEILTVKENMIEFYHNIGFEKVDHLALLGFFPFGQPNVYKHERAPIRAVISHEGTRCRLVYEIGEEFLSSLICDVDNTKHEVLMGLVDIKNSLTKLGAIR